MAREHILVTAQQSGAARKATLGGREHLVFPAVLVREQVLKNNLGATFLPATEIEASASEWNGVDAVIRHPTRNGYPISARDPEVLNAAGVGRLFNARVEDSALKAEVWIDLERADDVQDAEKILNVVNSGEPAELSTGFGARIENRSGTYDGNKYDVVLRDIQPDHLALLVEETGACSVSDGCGLGVNAKVDSDAAETLATRIWAHLKGLIGNQEISLDDRRDFVRTAAEKQWGDDGVYVYVCEMFEDDAVVAVDPNDDAETLYRVPYTIDEAGRTATLDVMKAVKVMRVTEFVPAENGKIEAVNHYPDIRTAADTPCGCRQTTVHHLVDYRKAEGRVEPRHRYLVANAKEERSMTREDLIDALCECEKVKQDRAALEAMEPDDLAKVANEAGVGEEGDGDGDAADPEPKPDPKPASTNAADETPAWAKALIEKVDEVANRVKTLEDETEPARNEVAAERERLIAEIVDNTEFTEAELEPKPVSELKKLHNATNTKPGTYVGLGGPRRENPRKRAISFDTPSTLRAGASESTQTGKED